MGGKPVIGGPLIVIGNYVQYLSQALFESDFRAPLAPGTPVPTGPLGPPLSFATIQTALATGKDLRSQAWSRTRTPRRT